MGTGRWHCYVMCGEWLCKGCGKWEFQVDQGRKSRIVPVFEGMNLLEMKETVSSEFGVYTQMTLSYWSPESLKFVTGVKTPPVMVTTEVGLDLFLKIAVKNDSMNLFVTFEEPKDNLNRISDERSGGTGWSDEIPTGGASIRLDDEDLLANVLLVEQRKDRKRGPIVSEADCTFGSDRLELSQGESSDEQGDDTPEDSIGGDDYVRPAGYDQDFWNNFLEEDLGGTDAVDVMCSGGESGVFIQDGVGLAGIQAGWSDPLVQAPAETRDLIDIDDEEFDIPPLFDDTEYETEPIPDLDREADDEVREMVEVVSC
ncbi:unnamed protein product [Arabidopsis arenosa]|uniref:Uncharacterized protein n=1 Tax=Arabidopsis arenosa TaxID=38785 RepID=A0A8S2A724_ARAAE|nr:unnamed protein product [Arabidopsis arenosa]